MEKVSIVGKVVAVESYYAGDEVTDYYAVYWDGEKFATQAVGYSFDKPGAVDAPAPFVEAYAAIKKAQNDATAAQCAAAYALKQAQEYDAELKTPTRGKLVKVVSGRKIPKGTVAEVVWFGKGKAYGYDGYAPYRVGIVVNGATVYTDAKNVEVIAQAAEGKAA